MYAMFLCDIQTPHLVWDLPTFEYNGIEPKTNLLPWLLISESSFLLILLVYSKDENLRIQNMTVSKKDMQCAEVGGHKNLLGMVEIT